MKDAKLPLLLTICFSLTLGGVGLSVPRASAQGAAATTMHDDGDGDELAEHWTEPKYAAEARRQMAGTAGVFALAAGLALRRRRKTNAAN